MSNKFKRVTMNIHDFPNNAIMTAIITIIMVPSHFTDIFHMNWQSTFFINITIDTEQYWIFINTFVNKATFTSKTIFI